MFVDDTGIDPNFEKWYEELEQEMYKRYKNTDEFDFQVLKDEVETLDWSEEYYFDRINPSFALELLIDRMIEDGEL